MTHTAGGTVHIGTGADVVVCGVVFSTPRKADADIAIGMSGHRHAGSIAGISGIDGDGSSGNRPTGGVGGGIDGLDTAIVGGAIHHATYGAGASSIGRIPDTACRAVTIGTRPDIVSAETHGIGAVGPGEGCRSCA